MKSTEENNTLSSNVSKQLSNKSAIAEYKIDFTKREIQILTLSAYGKTYDEIAGELSITADTAKDHMEKARTKLGANSKVHAIALSVSGGFIKIKFPDQIKQSEF